MKTLLTTLTASLIALTLFANGGETEGKTMKLNTEKSTIFWTGKKLTGQHTGTLNFNKGNVTVSNGMLTSIKTNLNMESIIVSDIEDPEYNTKLTRHLHSPDFFSTEEHPVGKFESTSITPIEGATGREHNITVKGNLTLKGITKPVEFPAFVKINDNQLVANGEITIDRSKWNIRYGSDSFFEGLGDKAIYDDIELNFVVLATK